MQMNSFAYCLICSNEEKSHHSSDESNTQTLETDVQTHTHTQTLSGNGRKYDPSSRTQTTLSCDQVHIIHIIFLCPARLVWRSHGLNSGLYILTA